MEEKKSRVRIPIELSATMLFESDHTCCVCNEPGLPVQIHHIDGDAANNTDNNLAVLCLTHHHDTQTLGGFAKHLSPLEVSKYRSNWLARVKTRREEADRIAIERKVSNGHSARRSQPAASDIKTKSQLAAVAYIAGLPSVIAHIHSQSISGFDSGVTSKMVQSAASIIDVLRMILLHLVPWFPPNHFSEEPPDLFISAYVASRFKWHRAIFEPSDPGTAGTMVRPMIVYAVSEDLDRMVVETVRAVMSYGAYTDEVEEWLGDWNRAKSPLRDD